MTEPYPRSRSRRRPDLGASVRRDADRLAHRQRNDVSFWRSLNVIGAVGWPIVAATVGGALIGRWMHAHWNTGLGVTALLVGVGAAIGMVVAWHLVHPRQP